MQGLQLRGFMYYAFLLRKFSRIVSEERFPLFSSLRVCVCDSHSVVSNSL